jgi:ankyrin repeat protein
MDVNARLNAAVKARDVRRVREALRKGGDPNHRERPEDRGLLYLAAAEGDVQIAAAMLEAGAKLACEPDTTVLHAAVLSRNPELMDLLLKAGGKRLINRFDG